ncbi:MAG: hypothetical protein R8F63_15165 [Acidimicrobiales bacterium]|nr:hypothetical protein [Acidimicrobiales bacterium]
MTDWPAHWRWRVEPGFDRPVAIFDMDGVLSDASHRQQYLREDPPNWAMFNSRAGKDAALADGLADLRATAVDHQVVVVTARPAVTIDMTEQWLAERDLPVELLVLRADGDERHSPAVKADVLAALLAAGADIRLAVEDHPGIVEMYERAGVPVRYVHSGYYDVGEV